MHQESVISINPNSGYGQRTIIHELLHAITIAHEHQRGDRNNYVRGIDNNDPQTKQLDDEDKPCVYRQFIRRGAFDYASIMNYGAGRYVRTNLNVHIKQARFEYNLTDGIPIAHRTTESNRNTPFETDNAPQPIINNTLISTTTRRLINRMDNNLLCYGRDYIINIVDESISTRESNRLPIGYQSNFNGFIGTVYHVIRYTQSDTFPPVITYTNFITYWTIENFGSMTNQVSHDMCRVKIQLLINFSNN